MRDNLKNKIGINLVCEKNLAILKQPYTRDEYLVNVLDAKLKVLPEFENNMYHFITGMTSEFIELMTPFQELYSLSMYHNILSKDITIYSDNLLWNLFEEMGDYQFFRNGLIKFMEIKPRNVGYIHNFEMLVNVVNNELTNIGESKLSTYSCSFGDVMGIQNIVLKLIECIISAMKKNVISGKETTFEMMRNKMESLTYSFDVCFQFILQLTDKMTCRLADTLAFTDEEKLALYGDSEGNIINTFDDLHLVDYNSIYHINDMKLSKRYKGILTNEESENRDYDNEKALV